MEKFLEPKLFTTEPNSTQAELEWIHWLKTFENFLASISKVTEDAKLQLLINHVSHSIYNLFSDCKTYSEARLLLNALYVKPRNEIYARHKLATRKQLAGETIDQYTQALFTLSKECSFKPVTAEENRNDFVRDSFISGLSSSEIRRRLLENTTLDLKQAIDQARALEDAQKHSAAYHESINSTHTDSETNQSTSSPSDSTLAATSKGQKCYFCGRSRHPRSSCPAREAVCKSCQKVGHFAHVCNSSPKPKQRGTSAATNESVSAAAPGSLSKSLAVVTINGYRGEGLIDTGSSESFVSQDFANRHKLPIIQCQGQIAMASTSLHSNITGYCYANIKLSEHEYPNAKLSVMPDLCADVIIGHNILREHCSIEVNFGGKKSALRICSLSTAKVEPPLLFSNLSPDCRPIATRSRHYGEEDRQFIAKEIEKLLSDGIIEESNSPWRAQVLVTKNENHKKRMVVDYSQTINLFTALDAYPLPKIEEIVAQVSKGKYFSTIDLRSAYHQIPIRQQERKFTGFEAAGKLYHFKRIPFGVTNGVACFQRVIDRIIADEKLEGVYAYLDDITVCGKTKAEHDERLELFLNAAQKYNLTLNEDKCSFNKTTINLLGYQITDQRIRPDPSRLEPLKNLPVPTDSASLKRAMGMFAHFAKWIPNFSQKISCLVNCKSFPLNQEAISAFQYLKTEIAKSAVSAIEDNVPFVVETDASDGAIAATLSQNGRPVAFFSRTLSKSERNHSAVEKEAYAIVEALKKWRHFLIGRHFTLITDQKSVSFMFDAKHSSKIKNEKILRWRLELTCYSFNIIYRPGSQNAAADTFSRICNSMSSKSLLDIHQSLCHPGVTKMLHWVKTRNLPYSVEEVRRMTSACPVCAEVKPRFLKNYNHTLIKATAPMERLNIDFKGPLPTCTNNRYLLTVVDEFSRFPFAFPCSDMSAATVIKCLMKIFVVFGMPSYIHSDQGANFMSEELKSFLHSHNVATSRTTPYNPEGNGQIERYNGIIWKTITLDLKAKSLKITQWESVLDNALFCIRSLLCTSTNCTPHERMFTHPRRTCTGTTTPSWLSGPVLMKKFVRNSKYEPLVEEVELLHANPDYATVRKKDGREVTVSLKHLAPRGDPTFATQVQEDSESLPTIESETNIQQERESLQDNQETLTPNRSSQSPDPVDPVQDGSPGKPAGHPVSPRSRTEEPVPRSRSARQRKPPRYLQDYATS